MQRHMADTDARYAFRCLHRSGVCTLTDGLTLLPQGSCACTCVYVPVTRHCPCQQHSLYHCSLFSVFSRRVDLANCFPCCGVLSACTVKLPLVHFPFRFLLLTD